MTNGVLFETDFVVMGNKQKSLSQFLSISKTLNKSNACIQKVHTRPSL